MEIIDIKDSIVSEQIKASIDEMVNAYCDELIKQDKEITRLNNIINELEKWLEYSINEHTNVIKSNNDIYWETIHKEKYEDRILIMSFVLDKIKELKEKSNDR